MKILLINDTRNEDNVGCHATVNELIRFVKAHIGYSEFDTLPMGTEYDHFLDCNLYRTVRGHSSGKKLKSSLSRLFNKNPSWEYDYRCLNFGYWKSNYVDLLSERTKNYLQVYDFIIVNMEGTIHHNNHASIALLSMVRFCIKVNKIVWMVNGTYQSIDSQFTEEVLPLVNFVAVREPRSKESLASQVDDVQVIPDFAFRTNIWSDRYDFDVELKQSSRRCLYTPGVLAAHNNQYGGLTQKVIIQHIKEIRKAGYEPYFLMIERREKQIADVLGRCGVATLNLDRRVTPGNIGSLIDEFDLIITGRYHIGIFSLMCNKDILFLSSNTYKIEGLLDLVKAKNMMMSTLSRRNIEKLCRSARYSEIDELGFESKFRKMAMELERIDKKYS